MAEGLGEGMNQILKNIYRLGNLEQVGFISELSGMTEEERYLFFKLHEGDTDLNIQTDMNLSRSAYEDMVDAVRIKLIVGVFNCIDYRMNNK